MRKKVKRIAAIIITCAVFINSSYNPVFAEYEDDTDWLYDSETEEDYDDYDYDTDENYDNYDSDYEEDNETVYDDYNTSYDNNITAASTTLQNTQSENTSNTTKETLIDSGTTMIKTKADGTQVIYKKVSSISELDGIRYAPSENYILTADIDMTEATKQGGAYDSGHGWKPIENFTGNFDGNGYRIIGMNIYGSYESYTKLGLFADIPQNSTVENLGMVDVNIDVDISDDSGNIGTITGINEGDIERCFVTGKIQASVRYESSHIGGIVGYNHGTISDVYNLADIKCDTKTWQGGICGYNSYDGGEIINCYNRGEIIWEMEFANMKEASGSIVGNCSGTIQNTYYLKNAGDNIWGWGESDGTGIGSKSDITGQVQGISEQEMKTGNFFSNLTDTWEVDPFCASVYPYPQLKTNRYIRVKSLAMNVAPSQLTYQQGEQLSLAGSQFTITYDTKGIEGMADTYETVVYGTQLEQFLESYDMSQIGQQKITINLGGQTAAFSINVEAIQASQILLDSEVSINKSTTKQLSATILPENASNKSLLWSSSNEQIVTVDANGVITGKKSGTADIMVMSATSGCWAKCKVTVTIPCISILLNKNETTLLKDGTEQLACMLTPLDTTDTITWQSSNTDVATVNNGLITACQAGEAQITAITESGKTASCRVAVTQDLSVFSIQGLYDTNYSGVAITPEFIVTDGYTVLRNGIDYTVTYSNNTNPGTATATVSGIGYYQGQIAGNWIIKGTATNQNSNADNNQAATNGENTGTDSSQAVTNNQNTTINSSQAATNSQQTQVNAYLSQKSVSIAIGKSKQLYLYGASGAVKWKSKNKSIATVNSYGLVKPKQIGSTTITATCGGKTYSCKVKVESKFSEDAWYLNDDNCIDIIDISGKKMIIDIEMPNLTSYNKVATIAKNGKTATCKVKCKDKKWHTLTLALAGKKLKVTETSSCGKKIILDTKQNNKKTVTKTLK